MSNTTYTWAQLVGLAYLEGEENCTVPKILAFAEPLPLLGKTYHKLITEIGGVATILCCVVCAYISMGHLTSWVRPDEQKQIVRIVFTLPMFAIFSFFGLWFYGAAGYLQPIPQLYEAFAIVALFYLYVVYISPDEATREQMHDQLERKNRKGEVKHNRGSLRWFKWIWISIFQLLLGRIATTILTEWVWATQCPLSKVHRNGVLIASLIQSVDTAIAVIAVINYERRMKNSLKQHRALMKLICFKSIVAIQFLQTIIFTVLASTKKLVQTKHISLFDWTVGTPTFMLCIEVFLFSISFVWAFESRPYRRQLQDGAYKHSFGKALIDVFNVWDIIKGVIFMFKAAKPMTDGKRYINSEPNSQLKSVEEVNQAAIIV